MERQNRKPNNNRNCQNGYQGHAKNQFLGNILNKKYQEQKKYYQQKGYIQNKENFKNNQQVNFYNGVVYPQNQIGYHYFDKRLQQDKYFILPKYHTQFNELISELQQLQNYQDKKWNQKQKNSYNQYLDTVIGYVQDYVFSGKVTDYNDFVEQLDNYCKYQNKEGYQIYLKQKEFLENKKKGLLGGKKKNKIQTELKNQMQSQMLIHNFNYNKTLTESKNEEKKSNKPQPIPKQQKEIQQIPRKSDPIFQMNQLMKRKWQDNDYYVSKQLLWKKNANIIFIGHVDSGKSTLTGNILKNLNQFDQQQFNRNKNQAKERKMQQWTLAYCTDIDPSERQRGKTIECSKLIFTLKDRRYTLFDAPGHNNYVPSMIMGACQSDIAVLIISAKEGQFQSGFQLNGQTKQHAILAKTLGVQGIIVVITKMSTVNWSEARYNQIKSQVQQFLQLQCGFDDKEIPFIPIDSLKNIGIHEKVQQSWYQGPCLIQVLNTFSLPERNVKGPLRIPVIDKYKYSGSLYIYGKVQSGIIEQGQTVSLLPKRKHFTIKQILNAKDQKMPFCLAGQNVKLRIKGIQQQDIQRGDLVCSNNNFCQQSQQFKADITLFDLPDKKKLMTSGYQCIMHMHAIVAQVQILKIEGVIDQQTFDIKGTKFLKSRDKGKIIIKVPKAICLQKYDFMPNLGRFTLRDDGKTIGYGQVTKIKPIKPLTKEQKENLIACQKIEKEDYDKTTIDDIQQKLQKMEIDESDEDQI